MPGDSNNLAKTSMSFQGEKNIILHSTTYIFKGIPLFCSDGGWGYFEIREDKAVQA